MRAGLCTVSAPLAACSPAGALPPAARFLALHLLHQQTIYFIVQAKSRVRELYQQTCLHFAQQGMLDTDLFGLALICDGEYLFAEPDSKLSKYAPKSWRSSHSHGLDANGRPALAFYFRVQFYVDSPLLLRDETTRQHYYLQLRLNAASTAAAGEHSIRLGSLALQADFGDHGADAAAFRPEDYVPSGMREPAVLRALENAHRGLRNVCKMEARARFIAEACKLEAAVNAHVFQLRASKHEPAPGGLLLAVCPRGLRVCPDNNPPSLFLWSSIGKLSFERKKFEIRTGHEKLTLYTSSDEKSRLLLSLCKAAHQFSMAVAPRLTEAKKEEEEMQRWDCDQRISVISSTSSNTTSGIVSDRVHSEDELEIMITSPPAPSTESLAIAHLLDSGPASSRTSNASAVGALATLSLKDEEVPSESSAGKPGKFTGSQCSSSCSTVVVSTSVILPKSKRRPSTSSSLELGYSHTAQNSVVSDSTCTDQDLREPVYTSGPAPSSHTSGVYTLSSSEQYTTPSEEYSTLGAIPLEEDQVDGYRNRSNSNVSNSGSFRGDGSDPTDNQHTLLSAEELSDLIVGRYPSCKSGYIPIPPKRIDSIEPRARPPPPPYPAAFDEGMLRDPPPYPENLLPPPPPVYPSEEVTARFITTRPPNILTAHTSLVSSSPSYSSAPSVPPIPPKHPRSSLGSIISLIIILDYMEISDCQTLLWTAAFCRLLLYKSSWHFLR
ncbi:protein expanded-like [Atheta coriaria]|uniref:protein expanded-like n=1 Tax=Dalotia coriaria TaxID=877792 RepID=UPI0031F3FF27